MAERSAKQLGLSQADLPNSVLEVIATLTKDGYEAYIVGGGVRDTLLDLRPKDFDAVTDAKPHEIKDLFGKRCRIIGRRFQLAHVYSGRDMIEVATFRAPPSGNTHTTSDGMIVRDNVWGDIKQDFARRDFSINALYYQPIKGVVHDFCNALDDIQSKTLRLLGHAPLRIEEDPVRLLRALRFKAKLGFDFDTPLAEQFNNSNWALLDQVSPHRLYDESQKMFTGGYLVPLLPLLFEYGAIKHLVIYPPDEPTALVTQVAVNTDKRIGLGKSINPAFFYAALLWDNYLYQLAKLKKKNMPFHDAQLQAASKVIDRQRIKTAIPKFAEQFIRDIWIMQTKLAKPRAKQIGQLAEHPRFRAAFDFLVLREQCDDASNPLSESTNGMGEWWQTYQTLSDKEKQQAIDDFAGDSRRGSSKRSRPRNRNKDATTQAVPVPSTDEIGQDLSDSNLSDRNKVSNDKVPNKNVSHKANNLDIEKNATKENTSQDKPHKNDTMVPKHRFRRQAMSRPQMSRPQKAHYAREREQLHKLSLVNTADGRAIDDSIDNEYQPKPLFTISADKLAKQLPQNPTVDEPLTTSPKQTLQAVEEQTAQDNKDVSSDTDTTITDDKKSHVKAEVADVKVESLPKTQAIPHKRRRRQPSTEITQIEHMSQHMREADRQQPQPATKSKPATNTPKTKAKPKPKRNSETQAELKPKSTAQKLASKATSTVVKSGFIPATRRRRQPSSTQSINERLALGS